MRKIIEDILKIVTNCYTYDNDIRQYYSNYSGAMLLVQQCYDIPKFNWYYIVVSYYLRFSNKSCYARCTAVIMKRAEENKSNLPIIVLLKCTAVI